MYGIKVNTLIKHPDGTASVSEYIVENQKRLRFVTRNRAQAVADEINSRNSRAGREIFCEVAEVAVDFFSKADRRRQNEQARAKKQTARRNRQERIKKLARMRENCLARLREIEDETQQLLNEQD